MEEIQLTTYSHASNAIEAPNANNIALFYLANNTTLTITYNSMVYTIISSVQDYAAIKVNDDSGEYFILYILSDGNIKRYHLTLHLTSYDFNFNLDIVDGATSLDIYTITDTQHSISYIDTNDQIHYIKFDGYLGVEYYWDSEDARITNQIEYDDQSSVGIYMVDGNDTNVNLEGYEYQTPFIVISPLSAKSLNTEFKVDVTNAILDHDNTTITINGNIVTYTYVNNIYTFRSNHRVAVDGQNEIVVTDSINSYIESVKLLDLNTYIPHKPKPKGNLIKITTNTNTNTTSSMRDVVNGRGVYEGIGSPGTRIKAQS